MTDVLLAVTIFSIYMFGIMIGQKLDKIIKELEGEE